MLRICVATTAARCSKYDEREVCGAALYTTYLRTYTAATYYTRHIYIYNFYIKRHITVTIVANTHLQSDLRNYYLDNLNINDETI